MELSWGRRGQKVSQELNIFKGSPAAINSKKKEPLSNVGYAKIQMRIYFFFKEFS